MLSDEDMPNNRRAGLGHLLKKAVICVNTPWHGYILMDYLFKRYPNRNLTYIGSKDSSKEQDALMEPFRRETREHHPADNNNPDGPITLISTYFVMAEGPY